MFDLFRSRDKAVRYLLGGLLTLVALSMVTYLIPGYGSGTVTTSNPILADIGGQKISAMYAQQKFQLAMRGATIPPEMLDIYLPQFIENMILQRAAVYQARRLGLTATDDEVLQGMILSNPQFFPGGVLSSKDQLEEYFAQMGMTLDEALNDMRDQLLLRKLQNALLETTVVPEKEVMADFKKKYDRAKIQYIAFPQAKFRDQAKISEEAMRKEFDGNRAQYTIPEQFSYQVAVVDKQKVEPAIQVTDAELRQAYNTSIENFRTPERVHARHILLKTEGKSDADKKALQAKAEDLIKQIKSGADFGAVATKNSEDAAEKGGDLGWIVRGQTVPEFEQAAFALKPKDISGVVTTQFGYHIIQALEHEQARVKTFDEVKAELTNDVRQRLITEKMQQLADQVRSALVRAPKNAADAVRQTGTELITMTKAPASDAIPGLGNSPEIGMALMDMQPDQVSDIVPLPSDRFAVIVLHERTPTRQAEFDEVKDQVKEKLIGDETLRLSDVKAKEAAERLRKGEDINAVARSMGLEVTISSEFTANDSVEGLGSALYVDGAFTQPVGSILGPGIIQGRNVVSKVISKAAADMTAYPAERETLLREIKLRKGNERNELMLDSILNSLVEEGEVSVNRVEIQRLLSSYRNGR